MRVRVRVGVGIEEEGGREEGLCGDWGSVRSQFALAFVC